MRVQKNQFFFGLGLTRAGKGYPDITLLEPIADVFSISAAELISGNTVYNSNVSANMMKSKFYICPICGNVIHSMGEAVITCHGILMTSAEPEDADENHKIFIERVEDEYYVRIEHDMTKHHYISFLAAQSSDRIQMVKLYPEGNAEARFQIRGVKRILSKSLQEYPSLYRLGMNCAKPCPDKILQKNRLR